MERVVDESTLDTYYSVTSNGHERIIVTGDSTSSSSMNSNDDNTQQQRQDEEQTKRRQKSAELESAHSKNLAAVRDIEKIAQKKGGSDNERFKVTPDDEYPDTYMNREELRREMNKKSSTFHHVKGTNDNNDDGAHEYGNYTEIGQVRLEILQCFGLPASSLLREGVSAYCIAVCGPHAFKTDTMPPVANPMWLSRMRRAFAIPIYHGFARLFIGCFDHTTDSGSSTDFIGRIVLDIARLRPNCTYDITLPLRQSPHVFERNQRGSIRVRFHLTWNSERQALLSYLPKSTAKLRNKPNEEMTINCIDNKSFRDVALVVHGKDMPGHFNMKLVKSTIREINFTQVHIMRYLRKREVYNLRHYIYPFMSSFVFLAWMHCVYVSSVKYVPGHIITYILLHLWKNYAYYVLNSTLSNGFVPPTYEELFCALIFGSGGGGSNSKKNGQQRKNYIEPLDVIVDDTCAVCPTEHMKEHETDDDYVEANTESISLSRIAESMRQSMRLHTYKHRFKRYDKCFLGTEAVDFLVSFGFAHTRDEAVILGRKLERELKLFENVEGKHRFDDEPYHYYLMEYDTQKYIIKGHEPKGKGLFKAIGFLNHDDDDEDERDIHVPFPFATGMCHPRFTVKQSLVVRSNRGKKLIKEQEELEQEGEFDSYPEEEVYLESRDDMETTTTMATSSAGGANGLEPVNGPTARFSRYVYEVDASSPFDSDDESVGEVTQQKKSGEGYIIEERILKPPCNQDMGVAKRPGNGGERDKSLAETLQETRYKAHNTFFHVFHNPTFRIDQNLYPTELPENTSNHDDDDDDDYIVSDFDDNNNSKRKKSKRSLRKRLYKKLFGKRSNRCGGSGSGGSNKKDTKTCAITRKNPSPQQIPYNQRKNECDRILNLNKHSSSHPMISRAAVFMQPLLEIAQLFLFIIRAIFNVFTWQDPILSFWVATLGPIIVLVLHFAPWRIIFGIAGIVFVGPQNWIIRVMKQHNGTYIPPNFDKVVKKKHQPKELNWDELEYFSKDVRRGKNNKNICTSTDIIPDDPMQVKQVIVPYSKLMFNSRFYDWPPEPEYAKVYESPAPENDDGDQYQDNNNNSSSYRDDRYDTTIHSRRNRGLQISSGRKSKKLGLKMNTGGGRGLGSMERSPIAATRSAKMNQFRMGLKFSGNKHVVRNKDSATRSESWLSHPNFKASMKQVNDLSKSI